jgi:hypothetical protein
MGEACGKYGGVHKYRKFNPKDERPLGRNRGRWEKNSPQESKEIRGEFVEWTDLRKHKKK